VAEAFKKLEELKPLYFNETDTSKKQEQKNQIDKLIKEITNNDEHFDFKVYFSEVFHKKKGFDIVIGNPPYGAELSSDDKRILDSKFNKWRSSTKNSAIYFIYTAINICHKNGINSFIVPKSLCYSLGWNKCASFLLPELQKLIDSGKAFEHVKLEQVIFLKQNGTNQSFYINGLFDGNNILEFERVSKDMFIKNKILLTGQRVEELKLINKIIDVCNHEFSEFVSIERGLNWQSKISKFPGKTPIHRGIQLFPYYLDAATDFINLSKFDKKEYEYQLRPKILNQLAIAHVKNPYPHLYLQAALDVNNKLVFETISCTFPKKTSVNIKFLLAINNSKLFAWLIYKFIYSNAIRSMRYDEQYIGRIPVPNLEETNQYPFIEIVDKILAITKDDDYLTNFTKQAKVKEYERQIDQMVYQLYGLTDDEIKIIKGYNT